MNTLQKSCAMIKRTAQSSGGIDREALLQRFLVHLSQNPAGAEISEEVSQHIAHVDPLGRANLGALLESLYHAWVAAGRLDSLDIESGLILRFIGILEPQASEYNASPGRIKAYHAIASAARRLIDDIVEWETDPARPAYPVWG